jgi:hypothetical protein
VQPPGRLYQHDHSKTRKTRMMTRRQVRHRLSRWGSRRWPLVVMIVLAGCGEPMFENAGSQHSLLEDREACAMEIDQSPEALAYRQNPTAHPDYMNQVFIDTNRCIERKGWKQVRSQQEQEQMREAITSELAQTGQPAPRSDSKAADVLVRGVEERLARVPSSAR